MASAVMVPATSFMHKLEAAGWGCAKVDAKVGASQLTGLNCPRLTTREARQW